MTSSNPTLVWFPTCFYHFFSPFLRVCVGIVMEHLFIREFECLSVCVCILWSDYWKWRPTLFLSGSRNSRSWSINRESPWDGDSIGDEKKRLDIGNPARMSINQDPAGGGGDRRKKRRTGSEAFSRILISHCVSVWISTVLISFLWHAPRPYSPPEEPGRVVLEASHSPKKTYRLRCCCWFGRTGKTRSFLLHLPYFFLSFFFVTDGWMRRIEIGLGYNKTIVFLRQADKLTRVGRCSPSCWPTRHLDCKRQTATDVDLGRQPIRLQCGFQLACPPGSW